MEGIRLQYVIQNDEDFKMQNKSEMIYLMFSNPSGLWEREMREENKMKKGTLIYGTIIHPVLSMYFLSQTMFSVLS